MRASPAAEDAEGGGAVRARHQEDPESFAKLARVLASIGAEEPMRQFLKELLTVGEMRDITLRWRLLEMLADKFPPARKPSRSTTQPSRKSPALPTSAWYYRQE